jgi:GH15 family glucan-1,4-alpha-glucosidase
LPEEIGGERNWDYRYSWLRDSSFTLYALAVLGYAGEARCYHDYLAACFRRTLPMVQIMYGIERECDLKESVLNHLEFYEGSRPVRVGNGAFNQRQIDVYGEVLDLALLYERLGGRLNEQYRRLLRTLAAFVAAHWREADQGLWEMCGPPRHYVHGKLMSWVALDRASHVLRDGADLETVADEVLSEVAAKGVDPEGGHLTQVFGSAHTDAALLLAPMLGLPLEHATFERTVAVVEQELRRGDFLLRYRSDDGLRGQEGEFLICSFWLVDALLATGRADDARALFDRLCGHANDVGLYAEEIAAESGAFLGNFPQAFTHLALIGSAVHLHFMTAIGRPESPAPMQIVQPAASVRLSAGAASGRPSTSAAGWAASERRSAPVSSGLDHRQASEPTGATKGGPSVSRLDREHRMPRTLDPALCCTGAERSAVDPGR